MNKQQMDKELVEKINYLVGSAVLKNDKNYSWEIIDLIKAREEQIDTEARLDELLNLDHIAVSHGKYARGKHEESYKHRIAELSNKKGGENDE